MAVLTRFVVAIERVAESMERSEAKEERRCVALEKAARDQTQIAESVSRAANASTSHANSSAKIADLLDRESGDDPVLRASQEASESFNATQAESERLYREAVGESPVVAMCNVRSCKRDAVAGDVLCPEHVAARATWTKAADEIIDSDYEVKS